MMVVATTLNIISAQSNYAELGNSGERVLSIIKILVVDNENSRPMSNAVVKLMKNSNRRFQIETDENGIAVIIIKDINYGYRLEDATLTIRDEDYRYTSWERNFSVDNYLKNNIYQQFIVAKSDGSIEAWNNSYYAPKNNEIFQKITNEDYKLYQKNDRDGYNYRKFSATYETPGFFEIEVRLNYQRHSGDRGHYDNVQNNRESQIYLKASSESFPPLPNGWKVLKDEEYEIRFHKDDKEVILEDWSENGRWMATEGYIGASTHGYVRGGDLRSLDVVVKLVYDFMKSN